MLKEVLLFFSICQSECHIKVFIFNKIIFVSDIIVAIFYFELKEKKL